MKPLTIAGAIGLAGILNVPAFANDTKSGVFGNLRAGYISSEDSVGVDTEATAVGGSLGYISPSLNGLSAGATFFTAQNINNGDECSYFDSSCNGFSLLGRAFIQGDFGNSMIRAGRFGIDTPFADTDDIRIIPNSFQGILITNGDIPDTTVYATHLTRWSGVDAPVPEKFTDMNSNDGINVVGVVYEGIENTVVQGWYYKGNDFGSISYLEAAYETDRFSVGAQYTSQNDDGLLGVDGSAYGITAALNFEGFTVMGAYNSVDGTVANGFGGGPFFTSSDDHTIDSGATDEEALAIGLEYGGFEGVTLSLFHVDFGKSQNETDYALTWNLMNNLSAELVYADMNADGHSGRLVLNYTF